MRDSILFYIPHDSNSHTIWDGQSIRTAGTGVSGTHQSAVIAAEQLSASKMYDQVWIFGNCNRVKINGVEYIDDHRKAQSATTLVIFPWQDNLCQLVRDLPALKNVVLWCACVQPCGLLQRDLYALTQNNTYKYFVVDLAQWASERTIASMDKLIRQHFIDAKHFIIPNGLMSDVLPVLDDPIIRPRNGVFYANFGRGGEVAMRVWNKLRDENPQKQWGTMELGKYTDKEFQMDKTQIFKGLKNARYFIYPLVYNRDPPYTCIVHRDTFACVVAEAIACGVEVFTYPVAALPEHYEDMVHWLPFPDGVTAEMISDPVWDVSIPKLFEDANIEIIAREIQRLDDSYDSRAELRKQNAEKIREKFKAEKIGKLWTDATKVMMVKKPKALFYIPKDNNNHSIWNGERIRTGGVGVSGTHQTYIIVAEQLIKNGTIEKAYLYNHCDDTVVNGVTYISKIDDAGDAEIVVVPSWISNLEFLTKNTKRVIMWFHWHFLFDHQSHLLLRLHHERPDVQIEFVHLSKWSEKHVKRMIPSQLAPVIKTQALISNAIMNDMLPSLDTIASSTRTTNDFVFIAGYDRGGDMAKRVWQRLKSQQPTYWGEFMTRAYHLQNGHADKKTVFELLTKAKYFVYPLVLPPDQYPYKIHRDTFACCVAEAIACGVEVLTYPVAALPEYYTDMVHFIPFPNGVTRDAIDSSYADPYFQQMYDDAQVTKIAELIDTIDKTYQSRASWRAQNAKRVRELYSPKQVGTKWHEFIHTTTEAVPKPMVTTIYNKNKKIL